MVVGLERSRGGVAAVGAGGSCPCRADNCSAFSDCFGVADSAAEAAFGLALLASLSLVLDFVPVVGTTKGIVEGVVGRDLITGEELAPWERALGVLPVVGALSAVKYVDDVAALRRHATGGRATNLVYFDGNKLTTVEAKLTIVEAKGGGSGYGGRLPRSSPWAASASHRWSDDWPTSEGTGARKHMERPYPYRPDTVMLRRRLDRSLAGLERVERTLGQGRGHIGIVSAGIEHCWERAACGWLFGEAPEPTLAIVHRGQGLVRTGLSGFPGPLQSGVAVQWLAVPALTADEPLLAAVADRLLAPAGVASEPPARPQEAAAARLAAAVRAGRDRQARELLDELTATGS